MGRSRLHDPTSISSQPCNSHQRNVFRLLSRREVCPQSKHVSKRRWEEAYKWGSDSSPGIKSEALGDAKQDLVSWVEAESLRHLSAKYCSLVPPPRSTIAAAFSPDGRTLASTHGDHTVKIIDCQTGSCIKVLSGHRRTPWVVRFHPLRPEILASGSLDHQVRLWDANSSECIRSHDFYRPIASIAFHAEGEILAVASGHKLYIWHYNKKGEASSPKIVLRTKRSLRAVHFHPHAAPFLITAEVNDLDSSDSSMTRATSQGYLRYPPPAVFMANIRSSDHLKSAPEVPLMSLPLLFLPSFAIDDSRIDLQQAYRHVGLNSMQVESSVAVQRQSTQNAVEQYDCMESPMDTSPVIQSGSYPAFEDALSHNISNGVRNDMFDTTVDAMETSEMQPVEGSQHVTSANAVNHLGTNSVPHEVPIQISNQSDSIDVRQLNQVFPSRDQLFQGQLMGQNHAVTPLILPLDGSSHEHASRSFGSSTLVPHLVTSNRETAGASLRRPDSNGLYVVRSDLQDRVSRSNFPVTESWDGPASINTLPPYDGSDAQPIISRIRSELATSLAAAELPCTVKLRVWSHDIKNSSAPLSADKCCLTIPHAVLCSEMGAHFSPCGRYLAACVACMLPHMEADAGLQALAHQDLGAATSPTRHPISAHQVMYELRIYSLEKSTFGSVLVSRAIRAAHCLTSIQFSPTSEHILLAYGRRHGSLLKSIVIDGETTSPVYTVLEVYRVSDMELVRVLPSSEDEVNVACFHPFAGGGLVYGTKEGKLRVLRYDNVHKHG